MKKRFTDKNEKGEYFIYSNSIYDSVQKLGKLEDFEESLCGCSLFRILNANQVYRKGVGMVNVIRVVLNEEHTYPYIDVGYFRHDGKWWVETLTFEHHYGIKFALTEEEFKEIKDGH